MNPLHKRQASRIIRNAKPLEQHLFELLDELQNSVNGSESFDWIAVRDKLDAIRDGLPLLYDLVKNVETTDA